jgi:hypothetical protein
MKIKFIIAILVFASFALAAQKEKRKTDINVKDNKGNTTTLKKFNEEQLAKFEKYQNEKVSSDKIIGKWKVISSTLKMNGKVVDTRGTNAAIVEFTKNLMKAKNSSKSSGISVSGNSEVEYMLLRNNRMVIKGGGFIPTVVSKIEWISDDHIRIITDDAGINSMVEYQRV